MTAGPPFRVLAISEGYPAATFRAWVAAELAGGTIPCACPHPVTADQLSLPSWTLRCAACHDEERPDSGPGACASCGAPGAAAWSWWLDAASRVIVTARVCGPCGTDGSVPVSLN